MRLYNTMTAKKEEFVPLTPGEVRMYACGPTVYNYFHIGNARPLIIFDALRRYMEYRGLKVTFVQNFTDVDDKIINRAIEEGTEAADVAEKYICEYYTDARGLGVAEATVHPKATEHISDMIDIISELIDKELAYEKNGDVYYRTSKFEQYGKLSKKPLDELMAGARVEQSDIKENPMDFALWKASKPGEPHWSSPWGEGRPGWHIECSAMSLKHLGETIDIHCGGQDLIFPHHENEIAQSEGMTGREFARFWLHNGFINIDSKKMSKSLGNFFTVREAAREYGYENIRMFMLMSHYRSPLNYSGDILEQAKSALGRIKTARETLSFLTQNGADISAENIKNEEIDFITKLSGYREDFCKALDDDFNTADAISVIFELVREANTVAALPQPSRAFAEKALQLLDELTGVLGLIYTADNAASSDAGDISDAQVEELIKARNDARAAKDWQSADAIRDKLGAMGIILEDTPQGVKWRRK